ncbi:MAG: YceD family protein [Nitriliruptoraceae bacterium]
MTWTARRRCLPLESSVRVAIVDLVDHPGQTRAIRRAVPASAFGTAPWGPTIERVHDPVELDLHLDAVVEGILVRGSLEVLVEVACGRCLAPVQLPLTLAVTELYTDPARREEDEEDDPGYELLDDRTAIDLSTLARDAVLIDLPVQVRCRPDCRGLCPVCGVDRNVEECGHTDRPAPDPRWAALTHLDLPPG